jgi:hypothetical protein
LYTLCAAIDACWLSLGSSWQAVQEQSWYHPKQSSSKNNKLGCLRIYERPELTPWGTYMLFDLYLKYP